MARNSIFNLSSEVWTFLTVVVSLPILVVRLGAEAFGLFSLAWVVIGYMLFLDIGVNRATTKFVSQHLATSNTVEACSVIRSALLTNATLGVCAAVALAAVTPWMVERGFKVSPVLQADARLVFYAIALALPILLVQGIFRSVLSSLQSFGAISLLNSIMMTAQWVLACTLAWRGFGVGDVVIATVAVRALASILYGIIMVRRMPSLLACGRASVSALKPMLRFGAWVSVSQVVSPLLLYLERLFIAGVVSLEGVALYAVPTEVTTRLRVIPSSLSNTLFPAFSERAKNHRELATMYSISIQYLLAILVPAFVFLTVMGPDVLRIWMGEAFGSRGAMVMRILALGAFLNCMAYLPYAALQAIDRPDLTGKFHLLEVPIHVTLCVLLIRSYGINGAALAGTLRYAIDAVLLFWAARKFGDLRSNLSRTGSTSLKAGVVLLVLMIAAELQSANAYIRVSWGIVLSGGYFVVLWMYGLDLEPKNKILRRLGFTTT